MNLTISPISYSAQKSNVSFGMAKFTEKGYALASQHADIYEPLAHPHTDSTTNPDFYKKKGFGKTPFTKFYLSNITKKGPKTPESVETVKNAIIEHGTSDNLHFNTAFIQQLISTEKYIHSASDDVKAQIGSAASSVFEKNWDNPELTKTDTFRLLEIAKYGMDDRTYVSLSGAVKTSDVR